MAATEGTVSATVTPQIISVTVTDGDVDYGTLDISESNNTFNGTAAETQTITNDSNVSADISLRSSDAYVVADTTDWALAGTAGSDIFVHSYDVDASGSASWTAFPFDGAFDNTYTSSVVTLTESGGANDNATLDLKIDMPSSISNTAAHSIDVTVQASAS